MRRLAPSLLILILTLTACQQSSRELPDSGKFHTTLTGSAPENIRLLCRCGDKAPIPVETKRWIDGHYRFSVKIPQQSLCRLSLRLSENQREEYALKFIDGKGNSSHEIYIRSRRIDLGTLPPPRAGEITVELDSTDAMLVADSPVPEATHSDPLPFPRYSLR